MEQLVGLPRIFIALCVTSEVSFVLPPFLLSEGFARLCMYMLPLRCHLNLLVDPDIQRLWVV